MIKINNFAIPMPNNIYVGKEIFNNKDNSSESLKVVNDKVDFGKFNQKIDESKFEKIETDNLEGVIEGENLYENVLQSIDKFLVNLTNAYSKEKAQIESNLTGEEKNKALESLNKRFDNTVKDYAGNFSRKPYTGILMKFNEDLINSIENIGKKAKEYIDNGNKPPSNMEEYQNFSDYVSQNQTNDPNHISLDALSKFDKIALNIGKYGGDFNSFVDKTDLPENLKNILKEANYMNNTYPFGSGENTINQSDVEKITKEANERKKYFDGLVSSKTERQEKAENEKNSQNDELTNQMLDALNSKNRLNNSIFLGIKTSSQKYIEFIKERKYQNINNYLDTNKQK